MLFYTVWIYLLALKFDLWFVFGVYFLEMVFVLDLCGLLLI